MFQPKPVVQLRLSRCRRGPVRKAVMPSAPDRRQEAAPARPWVVAGGQVRQVLEYPADNLDAGMSDGAVDYLRVDKEGAKLVRLFQISPNKSQIMTRTCQ
jgi:hypothetical protein